MGIGDRLALGLGLARRELRGGVRSLRVVLACLALSAGLFNCKMLGQDQPTEMLIDGRMIAHR